MCDAVFASFGADISYHDSSLVGHLKNGHDDVPGYLKDAVRDCDTEQAVRAFETAVMSKIKDSSRTR